MALLFLLATAGTAQTVADYTVTGELGNTDSDGKKIYIMRYDDEKLTDSTVVRGGRFCFRGKVDTATFCRIDITGYEFANFILEGGDIRVFPDYKKKKHDKPSGTPMNNIIRVIATAQDSLFARSDRKRRELRTLFSDNPRKQETEFQNFMRHERQAAAEYSNPLFASHNDDAVGFYLLYTEYMHMRPADEQLRLISGFGPWLKSRRIVKSMAERLEGQQATAAGKMFADICGNDSSGRPVRLSDFAGKGRYTVVDFWASWCGPCRKETPFLAAIHDKYKDKGVDVVGIFVWDKEENMAPAAKKWGASWTHIHDSGKTADRLYGISSIPHVILIGPDGHIVERGLRGKKIQMRIDEIINSENK